MLVLYVYNTVSFLLKKLILLFRKGTINWSKVMVKTFTLLQNVSILNTFCSSKNPKNKTKKNHGFRKNIKQHDCFQPW